ncbi:DNA binding protein [Phytophthora megakarya]|uniref:DNA binding protein n=1 Tax=Phytophthora megakarya TaxID=4795 RepID=A0A225WIC6_9STRA|nr:DNA binding protein [Phytophthora megakarya]
MSDLDASLGLSSSDLPPVRTVGAKRKRVVLSIHDKQQVLQRLESGEQPIAIARAFGISRQQVSDIKKNRERIVAFCIDAKHLSTLKRKTLKATSEYHPGVEQELYRWIIRQRKLGRAVSSEALSTKTTDLFMQYSPDASHMSFKAVTNWLRHFKKAHGIKSLAEDELQQLPEQFVPAMDMTRPGDVATAHAQVQEPAPSNFFSAISTAAVNVPTPTVTEASVDLYVKYVMGNTQPTVEPSVPSLQNTVNTVQQLNAQLARFERDMAIKLDYLDERVAKLCYLVLPTRLS